MEELKIDEKGYAFTPLVFLLFIPVMIIAVSFNAVVQEANMIAAISIGGDVTHTAVINIVSAVEKVASDAGRKAAYNATRKVIDENRFFGSNQSKTYIINNILPILNNYVITVCRQIEKQTGREIFINNISITNHTNATFTDRDITITQTEPFGFFVNVRGGIPIRVVQRACTWRNM